MNKLWCILLIAFFGLLTIQHVVSQKQLDSSDLQQDILAFNNEQYAKKTQLGNNFGISKKQKSSLWGTFHDRLFGQPNLAKERRNDNAINRNLENGQEHYLDRRRGELPVYGPRNKESSSSLAVLIFMLIVVVIMAIIWMEIDTSITRNLFRVVSQNDYNEQSGCRSSRRSEKTKKSKSRKSKSNSHDDSDSDSDLELGQKKRSHPHKQKRQLQSSEHLS